MIKLIRTDCIDGLAKFEPGQLDIVITSPPYNLGIEYDCEGYDDNMSRADYLDFLVDVGYAIHTALSDEGSFFMNIGSKPTDPTIPFEALAVMLRMFKLQNTIHWVKAISIDHESGVKSTGHYKPINSPRFINDCHEYIFHFTKHGNVTLDRLAVGVPYADESNVSRWSGKENIRCRGNTWYIPYKTIQSREDDRPHPATFPVELPERCFRLHGLDRIEWACDPFVGIGSSAIAAKRLGIKNFVGMDLSESYIRTAKNLLKEVEVETAA